jgi:drug/metabolite transporter (DMT)-like permease
VRPPRPVTPTPDDPIGAAEVIGPSEASVVAKRRRFVAAGWMLLASFLFAVMTVAARVGSSELPWLEVGFARSFFGLLVAVGVARARGERLVIEHRAQAWGRSLCGTCSLMCTFYTIGAPEIALGDATVLRSTTPIFIALIAPFAIREASGARVWLATPIAFLGAAVIARPSFHLAGHLAALSVLGAMFSASAMMFLRKLGPRESPEAVAAHFSGVASAILLVLGLPVMVLPTSSGMIWLAVTGVSAGLGQLAMTRAYALDQAARVGTMGYAGVVMTQVLAVLVLDERPTGAQILGSFLVISAGLILTLVPGGRGAGAPRARAVGAG